MQNTADVLDVQLATCAVTEKKNARLMMRSLLIICMMR